MVTEPRFDAPDATEMMRRIDRVRAAMEAAHLTHYVATCPNNVFYLTNFANYVHERPFVLVIGLDGPLQFLVPKLEIPHVQTRSIGTVELVEYFEFPAPAGETWDAKLRTIFPLNARVGLESVCPLQVYEAIPGERIRSDILEDTRMVKTDYEIGRIIYASNVAAEAMQLLLASAKPGVGLMEIQTKCRGLMLMKTLADNPSANMLATNATSVFQPPSVSHDPHNFTDVSMVMETGGPNVSIINGTLNGYGTEVERTFFLGDVPESCQRPFQAMLQVRELAFNMATPGTLMSDVDAACNALFKKAGHGDHLLHRTGHGIGVTGHEAPFFAEGFAREIEPGMVFTIEPGIYIEGIGGFRHSDTVLITDDGAVSLTPLPDDLTAMTLAA
ncbi:MAG: Xaa-Pro peptidase family protein [Pseudomonadota bacterium]